MPTFKKNVIQKIDRRKGTKPSSSLTKKVLKLMAIYPARMLPEITDCSYRTLKKIADGEESVMPHVLTALTEKLKTVKFN
ncbi:MAG: hypothetical protein U0T69_11355 [Chitinophagales bacterium]